MMNKRPAYVIDHSWQDWQLVLEALRKDVAQISVGEAIRHCTTPDAGGNATKESSSHGDITTRMVSDVIALILDVREPNWRQRFDASWYTVDGAGWGWSIDAGHAPAGRQVLAKR
jgi:hypothetical protein